MKRQARPRASYAFASDPDLISHLAELPNEVLVFGILERLAFEDPSGLCSTIAINQKFHDIHTQHDEALWRALAISLAGRAVASSIVDAAVSIAGAVLLLFESREP